jgi:hypothetical protein
MSLENKNTPEFSEETRRQLLQSILKGFEATISLYMRATHEAPLFDGEFTVAGELYRLSFTCVRDGQATAAEPNSETSNQDLTDDENKFPNPRLNNLSHFEELVKTSLACPVCLSKLYSVSNSLEQQLGGTSFLYCAVNEKHLFAQDRRTGDFWRITKKGREVKDVIDVLDNVQFIYDMHKKTLDDLKETRAHLDEYNFSDAEVKVMDEQITMLAGILSDLYRNVLTA